MSYCTTSPYTAARCEAAKKPTMNDLIKGGYMTKDEAAIYKAAEKIGFHCNISAEHNIKPNGLIEEVIKIRIEKTKSK